MNSIQLAFPLDGERVRLEPGRPAQTLVIVRLRDDAQVGSMSFETEETTLTIHQLCVDAPARSYGCGSEAAWLFLRAAQASGYKLVRAWAPATLGLAVYFWFRMGFHPLHGERPEGGIWLERRLV